MGQDYQHSLFHKNQKVVVDNYPHKDFQEHSAVIVMVLVPSTIDKANSLSLNRIVIII